MSVSEKVVLITGASSGIGAGTAEHLASIGYKKLALVSRRKDMLEQVAQRCKAKGATNVLVVPKDLTIAADNESAVAETVAHFGRLDSLFANAGFANLGTVRDQDLAEFERMYCLNMTSPFLLTKHSLPHLAKTKGSIVYTSSIAGHSVCGASALYASTKAALNHFARHVALEEAKNGIRVNVIAPGAVISEMSTQMLGEAGKDMTNQEKEETCRKVCASLQPLGRVGESVEMGKLFAFLISDDNTFMTGSVVTSDGGMTLRPISAEQIKN